MAYNVSLYFNLFCFVPLVAVEEDDGVDLADNAESSISKAVDLLRLPILVIV